jgi:hypothetical protein
MATFAGSAWMAAAVMPIIEYPAQSGWFVSHRKHVMHVFGGITSLFGTNFAPVDYPDLPLQSPAVSVFNRTYRDFFHRVTSGLLADRG